MHRQMSRQFDAHTVEVAARGTPSPLWGKRGSGLPERRLGNICLIPGGKGCSRQESGQPLPGCSSKGNFPTWQSIANKRRRRFCRDRSGDRVHCVFTPGSQEELSSVQTVFAGCSRYTGLHWRFPMTMVRQDQMPYYIPPQQFDPTQWFSAVAQVPQIWPQPSLAEIIVDILGRLVVVGAMAAVVYAGCELLFGEEKSVARCSKCGRAHTTRSCPMTGERTRLRIEKTGFCSCCRGRFSYTEGHHYAGRGVEKGREMCGPCHFHCGHDRAWNNYPINPRYCRLAA